MCGGLSICWGGGGRDTARGGGLLRRGLCAVLGQALLELFWRLELELLGGALAARQPSRRVACRSLPFGLRGVEVLDDALVVLLENVLGDTLHAEDLDVEALAVGERILDGCEVFLVDLVHVHREACERGQLSAIVVFARAGE